MTSLPLRLHIPGGRVVHLRKLTNKPEVLCAAGPGVPAGPAADPVTPGERRCGGHLGGPAAKCCIPGGLSHPVIGETAACSRLLYVGCGSLLY